MNHVKVHSYTPIIVFCFPMLMMLLVFIIVNTIERVKKNKRKNEIETAHKVRSVLDNDPNIGFLKD